MGDIAEKNFEIQLADVHIQIDDRLESEDTDLYRERKNTGRSPHQHMPKSKPIFHANTQSERISKILDNPTSAPLSYKTLRGAKKLARSSQNEVDALLKLRNFQKNNLDTRHKTSKSLLRIIPRLTKPPHSRPGSKRPNEYDSDSDSDMESEYYEESPRQEYDIQRSSSQLIDEHLQEIQVRINGHMKAALRYEKRDRIIGYPVTLLSSFVASTLMMNLSKDNNNNQQTVNVVGFSLSVISFVLSLSRDYLKYTTKFQAHDISSKLYTNLLRSIEVRLIGSDITIEDKRDMFKDTVDQMSIIEQYELPIPNDINREVRNEIFLPRSVVINHALRNER